MFGIMGAIFVIYTVHRFMSTIESIKNDYDEKIEDGWEDLRSKVAFRA